MEKSIRFSVIISTYNVENFIKRAIDSVLLQDYDNYEIIVVEDKSTDNTLDRILEYGEKIRLIKNEKNLGLGAVRNIGIKKAKGEYIVHLDGDDTLYDNNTLSKIDNLIGNNKPDIVFLGYLEMNGNNRFRLSSKQNSTKEARILCDACFAIPSKVFRRKFLIDESIEFVTDIYYEDMVYSIETVIYANNTIWGDFPIFKYYRNRQGSITTKPSIRRCTDMYKMLGYLMDLYQKTPNKYKPYLFSFIINETRHIPYKIAKIIEAIDKGENSPLFNKREYKMIDISEFDNEN